ncbi:MAG: hypothetical protein D6687_01650 [Acidobacteria bacterium]|jgi:hypothetical protein|nr:MAG: hypothetical protein D6687_01650 [Acidobacteriota bacterium]GIU81928.1 MAG: hypothetical protein KatS3mg006_0992 [Pyrinomonadaceae bacterium]
MDEREIKALERGYEENKINLRGILWFGIGLTFSVVITFVLMYILQVYMESQAVATKDEVNPVRQQILENNPNAFLPPEPRLQAAPGYGVDTPTGRVSLELQPPQAEWWTLEKIWKEELEKGQIDPKTGTVISLPIEEAKRRLLQEGIKARNDEKAKEEFERSQRIISYSSGGRLANEIRK